MRAGVKGSLCFPLHILLALNPNTLADFDDADNLMFFGCRSKNADFHYRSELEAAVEDGYLQLRVAASRDQVKSMYTASSSFTSLTHLFGIGAKAVCPGRYPREQAPRT